MQRRGVLPTPPRSRAGLAVSRTRRATRSPPIRAGPLARHRASATTRHHGAETTIDSGPSGTLSSGSASFAFSPLRLTPPSSAASTVVPLSCVVPRRATSTPQTVPTPLREGHRRRGQHRCHSASRTWTVSSARTVSIPYTADTCIAESASTKNYGSTIHPIGRRETRRTGVSRTCRA
jgi:hypothetical protein